MKGRSVKPQSSRGVALITALLILTIATTTAVFLAREEHLSIRRSSNVINGNQAYQYALGGETLAMTLLNSDQQETNVDGFDETWAQPLPPFQAGGFMIFGEIKDLQARFNINNLVNENDTQNGTAIDRFRRLIMQFGIEPGATNAVIDWLDKNISPSGPDGAEDDYYLNLPQPYRAANGPMHSVSELRLVKGFDVETFDQLARHLVALPERTAINLNTAPMEIWIAIGVDPARAERIARQPITLGGESEQSGETAGQQGQQRQQRRTQQNRQSGDPMQDADPAALQQAASFNSVAEALGDAGVANLEDFDTTDLSVSTEYFLFDGEVVGDRARAVLKSVLHRDKKGIMRVVMRSQGGL